MLWIDLPEHLQMASHLWQLLRQTGKRILPIGGDLREFPTVFGDPELARYVPHIQTAPLLPQLSAINESTKLYVLSRLLWHVGRPEHRLL